MRLKAAAEHVGRRARCQRCGASVLVPVENGATAQLVAPGPGGRAGHGSAGSKVAPQQQASAIGAAAGMPAPTIPAEIPESALRFQPAKMDFEELLDMTPMVDMTFLLLIFFLFTFSLQVQKSLEIPAPDATEESSRQARTIEQLEQDDFVVVQIDHDSSVWVNDALAPSAQELLFQLREARAGAAGGLGRLLVVAHGDARHETVVMVLDVGTAAGMDDVRLATVEETL